MNNVFDDELVSRQFTTTEMDRESSLNVRKEKIDYYIALLSMAITKSDNETVHSTLEDLFLERISTSKIKIWMDRIRNKETNLQHFRYQYLKMADWGFSPYHS